MLSDQEIDDISYSEEYAEFIMNNCHGDRIICDGDTLILAMEEGYLFEEFLESIGFGDYD